MNNGVLKTMFPEFSFLERLLVIVIAIVMGYPVITWFGLSMTAYSVSIVVYHVFVVAIGGFIKSRKL